MKLLLEILAFYHGEVFREEEFTYSAFEPNFSIALWDGLRLAVSEVFAKGFVLPVLEATNDVASGSVAGKEEYRERKIILTSHSTHVRQKVLAGRVFSFVYVIDYK